jgi:hypothetical protein
VTNPNGCSVCGPNLCVTLPENIFAFPNQPMVQCSVLEQAGLDGLLSADIWYVVIVEPVVFSL